MAKIMIGGQEYTTQPLKFKQLKKAFPLIKASQQIYKDVEENNKRLEADGSEERVQVDPIVAMETAIQIVAIALERDNPDLTTDKIESEISLEECRDLQNAIVEIVTESGFEATKPGEGAVSEGEASPSTETLTA